MIVSYREVVKVRRENDWDACCKCWDCWWSLCHISMAVGDGCDEELFLINVFLQNILFVSFHGCLFVHHSHIRFSSFLCRGPLEFHKLGCNSINDFACLAKSGTTSVGSGPWIGSISAYIVGWILLVPQFRSFRVHIHHILCCIETQYFIQLWWDL